jgi:putative glutamine amidotransferase
VRVNSLHHQAVNMPGDGLRVTGKDCDRICQAIESEHRAPIIGVQWHPEYLLYLKSQRRLFRWLVRTADVLKTIDPGGLKNITE